MVLMLHHEALVAPAENQMVSRKNQQVIHNEQKHFAYFFKAIIPNNYGFALLCMAYHLLYYPLAK